MSNELLSLLCSLPALLFALTFHEFSHGLAAYWLGDPTAKEAGRLTLNPLKHLDIPGAICMLLFHFGWAKPVPVNPRRFRKPKRGMALTALAGPVSNLLLAFIGMYVFAIVITRISIQDADGHFYFQSSWQLAVCLVLQSFYSLNLALAVFNFLPIPPLDGSRVLLTFLPQRIYFAVMRYETYILRGVFAYFLVSMLVQRVANVNINVITIALSFLIDKLERGMFFLVELLPFV